MLMEPSTGHGHALMADASRQRLESEKETRIEKRTLATQACFQTWQTISCQVRSLRSLLTFKTCFTPNRSGQTPTDPSL